MTDTRLVIALTAGEPAGIGPDLCALLTLEKFDAHLVFLVDRDLLVRRGQEIGRSLSLPVFDPSNAGQVDFSIRHIPLRAPARAGQLNVANASYVLETLQDAVDGCLSGQFDALVTAPVHKGIINDAGVAFSGHTEFLAQRTGTPQVVMMLVGGDLRVALATTHLPLRDVAVALDQKSLENTLCILHTDLRARFSLASPRILVAGLNPHAGEGGHLGREEIEVITPVLNRLRAQGMNLEGPLPADTLFTPKYLQRADCVLAMYHDQGLPVLKMRSFGEGVNVTLGLPIVRTSVDHGTALDLAGSGRIELGSMIAAVKLAIHMARTQTDDRSR